MKKRTLAMVVGMVGGLMLGTTSFAEGTVDFATLDVDQNGSLSAEEAAGDPELSARWSEVDSDKSDSIEQSEFSAFESLRGESAGDTSMDNQ